MLNYNELAFAFLKTDDSRTTIIDAIIDAWTGNLGYSHVEVILRDRVNPDVILAYRASTHSGIVDKSVHVYDKNIWDYYTIEMREDTLMLVQDFLETLIGDKYDYLGILGFIFLIIRDRENRWFCSELASSTLKISGDRRFYRLDPARVSPNMLYQILHNKDVSLARPGILKAIWLVIKRIVKYITRSK